MLEKALSSYTKKLFEVKKMHIDPNRLLADIRQQEKKHKDYKERISGFKNVLTLRYEDIIGRTEGNLGETKKYGSFNMKSEMYTYIPMEVCEQICNLLKIGRASCRERV